MFSSIRKEKKIQDKNAKMQKYKTLKINDVPLLEQQLPGHGRIHFVEDWRSDLVRSLSPHGHYYYYCHKLLFGFVGHHHYHHPKGTLPL